MLKQPLLRTLTRRRRSLIGAFRPASPSPPHPPRPPVPTTFVLPTTARQPERFAASIPARVPNQPEDHKPPTERSLNLGRTLRILRDRLPTLLRTPLPTDILSPGITLNLFPSTHPHLPTVRGRVAYIAALWTAPVAWGRLPGRARRLEVLSERMLGGAGEEVFVVRWRTKEEDEFRGVFLFEFDAVGRVDVHTIEEVEAEDAKGGVVGVTEWLLGLGKVRGSGAGGGGSGGGGGAGVGDGGLVWQFERVGPRVGV